MNKKIVLLALASMFLLSTVIGYRSQLIVTVLAQTRESGVNPGDWALYNVTLSGNATMPSEMNITWVMITVQEVSGTNITSEFLVHYSNSTETTDTYFVNVDTGEGDGTGWFIARDLNAGDLVYTSQDSTINETIFRTYPVGILEVNHFNYTVFEMNTNMSMNYYWRKTTGMITEFSRYQLTQQVGNITWAEMDILITNFGVIPEFPPALILPLFMIVTIAAVFLGKAIWPTKKLIKKPSPCT